MLNKIEILNKSQNKISKILQDKANRTLLNYGVEIKDLQILSIIPSKEIIEALDAKKAMEIIGNKQEYLLYKAANSLGEISSVENKSNDPMQMMLGMMLGKNLMVADFREKERTATTIKGQASQLINSKSFCSNCGSRVRTNDNFCSSCGEKLK